MKIIEKSLLFRIYASKPDAVQLVILCTSFSLALIGIRVAYTGDLLFLFLIWNLFLAFVPYWLSGWMSRNMKYKSKWNFFVCVFAWLLFIPNAFYIITDLFHLDMNIGVPLWFDLALLLGFAWNGLLVGIISIRQMEKLFETYFNKKFDLLFVIPVMFLNGLGVYVGRYLRFNSWDAIINPLQLVQDMIYLFIHPLRSRFDWSMIICYSLLLTLIYVSVKRLGKAIS